MDLKGYISILWRRLWVILATTVVALGAMVAYTSIQTPVYEASATLRIASAAASELSYNQYVYADRLLNTYIEIATSSPVLTELAKRLNLNEAPQVTAEIVPNTELIKIIVQDSRPKIAANAANTLANILITDSSKLYSGGAISSTDVLEEQLKLAKTAYDSSQQKYQTLLLQTPPAPDEITIAQQSMNLQQNTYANLLSQYEEASIRETMQANMMTIVNPATVPTSPSSPRKFLNYAIGLLIGLVGGVGLAFLIENMDTTLHTREEIESIVKFPPLVGIPKELRWRLDITKNGESDFAESFRYLASKIQFTPQEKPNRILVVLGAEPRDGKSMIVYNLAIALAETGKKVAVIDCDLRMPKLHKWFNIPNEFGLSDIMKRKAGVGFSLQKSQFKGVSVLTSGSCIEHPSKLFSSPQMAKLIESFSQKFDHVILDTPALLSFVDAEILVRFGDFILFVVRRNKSKLESVQVAEKFLEGFPDKPIGLVVNEASTTKNYGYYGYPKRSLRILAGKKLGRL